jgi:hypothetical protein
MYSGAASFNQDLSTWEVDGVEFCSNFSFDANAWVLPKPAFINCSG